VSDALHDCVIQADYLVKSCLPAVIITNYPDTCVTDETFPSELLPVARAQCAASYCAYSGHAPDDGIKSSI